MKNHKEMFEALLAGETLILSSTKDSSENNELTVYLCPAGRISKSLGLIDIDIFKDPSLFEVKPKTININGFEVPEPVRAPLNIGDVYYVVNVADEDYSGKSRWDGDRVDGCNLQRGLIHLTREAAIQHAKALLSLTMVDDDDCY